MAGNCTRSEPAAGLACRPISLAAMTPHATTSTSASAAGPSSRGATTSIPRRPAAQPGAAATPAASSRPSRSTAPSTAPSRPRPSRSGATRRRRASCSALKAHRFTTHRRDLGTAGEGDRSASSAAASPSWATSSARCCGSSCRPSIRRGGGRSLPAPAAARSAGPAAAPRAGRAASQLRLRGIPGPAGARTAARRSTPTPRNFPRSRMRRSELAYLRLMRSARGLRRPAIRRSELAPWAKGAREWVGMGGESEAFVFFINGAKERAPAAAMEFCRVLGDRLGSLRHRHCAVECAARSPPYAQCKRLGRTQAHAARTPRHRELDLHPSPVPHLAERCRRVLQFAPHHPLQRIRHRARSCNILLQRHLLRRAAAPAPPHRCRRAPARRRPASRRRNSAPPWPARLRAPGAAAPPASAARPCRPARRRRWPPTGRPPASAQQTCVGAGMFARAIAPRRPAPAARSAHRLHAADEAALADHEFAVRRRCARVKATRALSQRPALQPAQPRAGAARLRAARGPVLAADPAVPAALLRDLRR